MALFQGENPQLGTTQFRATANGDHVVSVRNALNSEVYYIDDSGNVNPNGAITVAASQSLTVTTADKLTVGGKIIPQTWAVNFLFTASTDPASWAYIAQRACKVVSIKEVHSHAGGTSAAVLVRKVTDTSAPDATASATVKDLISAAFDLTAAANTTQTGTLSSTASDYTFAAGDKVGIKFTGTLTALAGGVVTVEFQAV